MTTTLTAWWSELVAEHGTSDALVIPDGETLSFAALDARIAEVAGALQALGLGRGDRLASFVPNGALAVELLLAAARLGAVTIGVNTRYRADDLRHVLDRGRPRVLVSATEFLGIDFPGVVADALQGASAPPRVVWDHELSSPTTPPITTDAAEADDLAVAFTTSGTTGKPKLAAHSHSGTVRHLRAIADAYAAGPGDTALLTLPFCGTFGFVSLFAALGGGARVVVPARFEPVQAAEAMATCGVTHLNGSDDMLQAMLDTRCDLSTWRHGVEAEFTGQGLTVVERAEQVGARLTGVYGSSETFALLARWSPSAPVASRGRNGGVPVDPATGVRAVDPGTGAVLAHGEVGELQLRGTSVLDAYLVEESTAPPELSEDGWFATGDLAVCEPDGGFEYLARVGDTLRLAGFLTSPAEIEDRLAAHRSVAVAQVVGVEGEPGRGEVAVAFVMLAEAAPIPSESELVDHCRQGLANYKVPVRIVTVESFPTVDGANGVKIRKTELRDRAVALVKGLDRR